VSNDVQHIYVAPDGTVLDDASEATEGAITLTGADALAYLATGKSEHVPVQRQAATPAETVTDVDATVTTTTVAGKDAHK